MRDLEAIAAEMEAVAAQLVEQSLKWLEFARQLRHDLPVVSPPLVPYLDVIDTIPVNANATNPIQTPGRWATRRFDQIRGVTVHHTGTDDYISLARYCTTTKQLPTTQYTYFVLRDGQCFQCVPDDVAFWHDHTGYPNYNLSIGMAGYWHRANPPAAQLVGMAMLVNYLMDKYSIPEDQVQGHNERARKYGYITQCPGWEYGWRDTFFGMLAELRET